MKNNTIVIFTTSELATVHHGSAQYEAVGTYVMFFLFQSNF